MGDYPRILIAGTHSGAGKTTIATALMAGLSASGFNVQPFKVGPDYIDPGFHQVATGRVSRNLDIFFLGRDGVRELFQRSAASANISVIEGVMGLYDGIGSGAEGSSAQVAELLLCPVLLVVDARSMAASAAALVWGFARLPGGVPLAGVILNRIAGPRHLEVLKTAIESKTGVPVVGGIPRDLDLQMPERHLGLVPSAETRGMQELIQKLARRVMPYLEMEKIIRLAGSVGHTEAETKIFSQRPGEPVRLGIVRDGAFNFYYQDGLDLLAAMGAELVYCSALDDAALPRDLDGLYIGGGFPEMFLEQLEENKSFAADLRLQARQGLPLFAECGGLMYLCRGIVDFNGREWSGADILPVRCRMEQKRVALGYVTATALQDNILVPAGAQLRGHEFHYSRLEGAGLTPAYRLCKPGRPE
ncbi:MAG: cobyrinate a,c-diamide synthase, partial [Firmicutes bacterium]|nr:cobyrinate a,c-diamide synthase [Bacillota bacterium]